MPTRQGRVGARLDSQSPDCSGGRPRAAGGAARDYCGVPIVRRPKTFLPLPSSSLSVSTLVLWVILQDQFANALEDI